MRASEIGRPDTTVAVVDLKLGMGAAIGVEADDLSLPPILRINADTVQLLLTPYSLCQGELIEAHLRSDLGGRCVTCGQLVPCHLRGVAYAAFVRAGRLPQRRRRMTTRIAEPFRAFGTAA